MSSQLVESLLSGDIRALARAISLAEEHAPSAVEALRTIFPHTGGATVIGLTGPPGAGKSTLADRLVASYRGAGRRVGVVAVDPSSAFSGGALLGDRVRMQEHATDAGVFIRSMATRGHLGGLARATNDTIDLIDAAGFDPILVETVGVGQDEIDVIKTADAVAVILVPGMGDDIQAIKAGILEIADLFVINKADREGAQRLEADLEYMMSLVEADDRAKPRIVHTVAVSGRGVDELKQAIADYLTRTPRQRRRARRRERAEARFRAVLSDRLTAQILAALGEEELDRVVGEIAERRIDPYSAVERLLRRLEVQ